MNNVHLLQKTINGKNSKGDAVAVFLVILEREGASSL